MTTDLRERVASGATLAPSPQIGLPNLSTAEEFYSRGASETAVRKIRISLSGSYASPESVWFAAWVEDELDQLLRLAPGWDGHRAERVTEQAVATAVHIFFAITDRSSVLPQFFPLPDGGIQFEWHVGGQALEVEVDGAGGVYALAYSKTGGVTFEEELTLNDRDMVNAVRRIVRSLSDRVSGAR